MKNFLLCFLLFLLISCGQDPVDYTNAEPVVFNISIENQSDEEKVVVFERTKAKNDEFRVPSNTMKDFNDIVCINSDFLDYFHTIEGGGMIGKTVISIVVGDERVEIGNYEILCIKPNPTVYGEFISGELAGVECGVVSLKVTIAEDGKLTLEYLNIPR